MYLSPATVVAFSGQIIIVINTPFIKKTLHKDLNLTVKEIDENIQLENACKSIDVEKDVKRVKQL